VDLSSATARNKLMLLTTRANGELIEANDRFLGVLGYTRMEIFEQSSYSIWESIEQRTLLLRKCHAGGFEDLELNLVSKTNDMVPVCASAKLATLNNETYIFFGMREKR
jgi:PAS domain-containing protein